MAGFNLFFEGLQRLEGIKLARQQQALQEKNVGAGMMAVFERSINSLDQDARVPFTKAFASSTGISEELLQQAAAAQPTATAITTASTVQQGAPSLDPATVASAQMIGTLPGSVAVDASVARGAAELPEGADVAGALQRLTGMSAGSFDLDTVLANMPPELQRQIVEIDRGLQLSAPQETQAALTARGQNLNRQTNVEQMDLQQTIAESQAAIQLQDISARSAAAAMRSGSVDAEGNPILTPQQIAEQISFEAGVMENLQTKPFSKVAQVQAVSAIYQSMTMRGIEPSLAAEVSGLNAVRGNEAVTPGTFQRIFGTGKVVK